MGVGVNRLQQASALYPFPGELIAFFDVARFARYHQITDIVSRDVSASHTANGECMFNLMLTPGNFVPTVITIPLLPFVQISNILSRVRAWNRFLQCSAIAIIGIMLWAMGYPILFRCNLSFSLVLLVVIVILLSHLLAMIVVARFALLFKQIRIAESLLSSSLVDASLVQLVQLMAACSASAIKPIIASACLWVKVLRSFREDSQTSFALLCILGTSNYSLPKCSSFPFAFLATARQSVFSVFCSMKVSDSSGKHLPALHAAFLALLANYWLDSECAPLPATFFANGIPAILFAWGFVKVSRCGREGLFTLFTLLEFAYMLIAICSDFLFTCLSVCLVMLFVVLMPLFHSSIQLIAASFSVFFISRALARTAVAFQSPLFLRREVFNRCGEPSLAVKTLLHRGVLGYSVHALDLLCLASRPGLLQVAPGQPIILPQHYSINPHLKPAEVYL